jgi:hypothetical protein
LQFVADYCTEVECVCKEFEVFGFSCFSKDTGKDGEEVVRNHVFDGKLDFLVCFLDKCNKLVFSKLCKLSDNGAGG